MFVFYLDLVVRIEGRFRLPLCLPKWINVRVVVLVQLRILRNSKDSLELIGRHFQFPLQQVHDLEMVVKSF